MSNANSNVQVLNLEVDFDDKEDGEYRFLVDGKHVKYVTIASGALPKNDRTFAPVFIPLLPPFPSGDWNEGHISKDSASGKLYIARHEKVDLAGIEHTWHPTRIDLLDLEKIDSFRSNIHRVSHPLFSAPVIFKFAKFPWQIPYFEAETTAYEWIHGKGVGPEFLGHVAEHGRVMGWIMEDLGDARTAEPADLEACQADLARLHALGIKHGDINRFNFLIRNGGACLIDFETAKKCSEVEELEAEYKQLEASLNDPSFRGGVGPAVYGDEIPE